MIGVLVLCDCRSENDSRFHSPDHSCESNCMGRPDFQVSVTIEFYELEGSAKKFGGFLRFGDPLFGCSMRGRLAFGTYDEMDETPKASLLRNHSANGKFDII